MSIDLKKATVTGILDNKQYQVVEKQWGRELIIHGDRYTTKIMEVKPGFKCSVHFHGEKSETFVLVQGQLNVEFYEPDSTKHVVLLEEPMSSVVLPRLTPHTFSVPKDQKEPSIFVESSTPDSPEDSYRLTRSGMNA